MCSQTKPDTGVMPYQPGSECSHFDHVVATEKGYVMVTSKGDCDQISGWESGGLKEQAFDVVSFNVTAELLGE